jgi:hypothetical protein
LLVVCNCTCLLVLCHSWSACFLSSPLLSSHLHVMGHNMGWVSCLSRLSSSTSMMYLHTMCVCMHVYVINLKGGSRGHIHPFQLLYLHLLILRGILLTVVVTGAPCLGWGHRRMCRCGRQATGCHMCPNRSARLRFTTKGTCNGLRYCHTGIWINLCPRRCPYWYTCRCRRSRRWRSCFRCVRQGSRGRFKVQHTVRLHEGHV